jgi:hypothetical protein
LQNKLETNHKRLENKLNKLESSDRELKESNGQLQKDIEIKLEILRENVKSDLKTETEKLIQKFDLASENQVVGVSNQEKMDVILRRQGGVCRTDPVATQPSKCDRPRPKIQ